MGILCTLVPSECMVYSTGSPARSLTNTIWFPVLGFHAGEVSTPLEYVIPCALPPSASERKIAGEPAELDMNARCVPSGEKAGELLVPRKRGNEISRLESSEYRQICAEVTERYGT